MFPSLVKFSNIFRISLKRRLKSSLYYAFPLSAFTGLVFSVFYILFPEKEIFWLDLLGALFSFFVILSLRGFILRKNHIYFYWILFMVFLAFNGSYVVIKNPQDIPGAVGLMLVIMMLTIVISDVLILLPILILGVVSGYLFHSFSISTFVFPDQIKETMPTYLLALIFGIVLSRKRLMVERKLEGMSTLTHRLKHELNTPLMTIKMCALSLKQYIPKLIRIHNKVQRKEIVSESFNPLELDKLNGVTEHLEKECNAAGSIMDIMMMNAKETKNGHSHIQVSIYRCLEQAIERYPFPNTFNFKTQLDWQKTEDFVFKGIELLMVHVFLNLIKNAVYACLDVDREAFIKIRNTQDARFNYVYFEDTGKGIKSKDMANLFESFFTTRAEGTGLGLFFCKNTIEGFAGKITCDSTYGEGTTFTIKLPKIKGGKDQKN